MCYEAADSVSRLLRVCSSIWCEILRGCVSECVKLQALVYDIVPPTTATSDYGQLSVSAQMANVCNIQLRLY